MQERLRDTSKQFTGTARDVGLSIRDILSPRRLREDATHLGTALATMAREVIATSKLMIDDKPLYPYAWKNSTRQFQESEGLYTPISPAFIAIVGDSGTGKGTIVSELAKRLNISNTMVGGDMFRRVTDIYHDKSSDPSIVDTVVDALLASGLRSAVAGRGSLPKLIEGRRILDIIAMEREKEERRIQEMNFRRRSKGLKELHGPVPFTEGFVVKLTADPRIQKWRYGKRYVTKHGGEITEDLLKQEWQREQGQGGRREKDNARFAELSPKLLKARFHLYPLLVTDEYEQLSPAEQELMDDIDTPRNAWPYASILTDYRRRPIIHAEISTTDVIDFQTLLNNYPDYESLIHLYPSLKDAQPDDQILINKDPQEIIDEIIQDGAKCGYYIKEPLVQGTLFQRDPIVD